MTRSVRQTILTAIMVLSTLLLVLFLTTLETQDPVRPDNIDGLASWLAEHPADWIAASRIADRSFDSSLPLERRVALWRSSYSLARHLAPLRPNPSASFVRAGLFHWNELGPVHRQAVLQTAAPMLRDPTNFAAMHRPLWELTHDFGYLRRSAPRTINALWMLRELSVASGNFAAYRELRIELRDARMKDFLAKKDTATVAELIEILPQTVTSIDEPLVAAILKEIERRPIDVQSIGPHVENLALYAIRHDVQPLTALTPLVESAGKLSNPTRARLAIALNDRAAAGRVELTAGITNAAEWIPYHLERAAFEEKHGHASLAKLYRTRAEVAEAPPMDVWTNTCGTAELCTSVFRTHDGPLKFQLSVTQSDEIPPYIEVFVDDVLVAEEELAATKSFAVDGAGRHRTEVRIVNRYTRNGTQRRVRLS